MGICMNRIKVVSLHIICWIEREAVCWTHEDDIEKMT